MQGFATRPLCRNIASQGFCPYGRRCRFSHDPLEQSSRPPPKEIPCYNWEETGTCSYGDGCAYLHRPLELVGSAPLKVGLLQVVSTLERRKRSDERDRVTMSDFQELASYDWLHMLRPTITVPGMEATCTTDSCD